MKMVNIFYIAVFVIVSVNLAVTLWILFKEEKCRKVADLDSGMRVPRQISAMFSNREKEIAQAILEGKTNGEIAQEKCISPTTVKKHVYNLFQKTKARNRVEFINRLRDEEYGNESFSMTTVSTTSKH